MPTKQSTLPKLAAWMQRAFVYVESVLLSEIAARSDRFIKEEHIRTALAKGLVLSDPVHGSWVQTEQKATWTDNGCRWCSKVPGSGRRLSHDVAVVEPKAAPGTRPRAVCEVMWLERESGVGVLEEIARLVLTRGTADHRDSVRTFLLLAGTDPGWSKTLRKVQGTLIPIKWSPAGRPSEGGSKDEFDLQKVLEVRPSMDEALHRVLRWGKPRHLRGPESAFRSHLLTLRQEWHRTFEGRKWRAALWELHRWGLAKDKRQVDWDAVLGTCKSCKAAGQQGKG